MNGLYSQAILQQQAQAALYPNTHVSVPVSNNPNSWNNSAPIVHGSVSSNTINTSSTSSLSGSSSNTLSGSSSSGIFSTISTDFSKYFDYILIGGIVTFVFYMFQEVAINLHRNM